MAIGDILSVVARDDGWSADVTVDGFVPGATYDYGLAGPYNDPAAAKFVMSVRSMGFEPDGTPDTKVRTVYGTKTVRLPYPDDSDLDETDNTGSMTFRVALSEPVFLKDKTGAGNSGTNPTVSIAAGFVTNTGGDNAESNAVSDLEVTNESALAYPKVIGQWDWRTFRFRHRQTADFPVAFRAWHAFGIAGVVFSHVGATSANAEGNTVTAVTKIGPTADGLYYPSYVDTCPIAGFTQGEQIEHDVAVYPVIGDAAAVLDTSLDTDITDSQRGDTQQQTTCDKTGALIAYAVVRTVGAGGDNATGVVSSTLATADASPYATITAARAGGATVIYLTDDDTGTHTLNEPSGSLAYAVEIRRLPSDTGTITLSLNSSLNDLLVTHTLIEGVTLSGSDTVIDGENTGRTIQLRGVTILATGGTVPLLFRFNNAQVIDSVIQGGAWGSFSSNRVGFGFMACRMEFVAVFGSWSCVVACTQDIANIRQVRFASPASANPVSLSTNRMFDYNNFPSEDTGVASPCIAPEGEGDISLVGNVLAGTEEAQALIFIAGDNSVDPTNNFLIAHNTWAGERLNGFYQDVGTAEVPRTNIYLIGNAAKRAAFKSDTFGTPSGNRVGNWAFGHGNGHRYNRYDSQAFVWETYGVNCGIVGNIATSGEMGYTDEGSANGTGLGGGDYTPTTESALYRAMPKSAALVEFDLFGRDFPSLGNIGGVQPSDPPPSPMATPRCTALSLGTATSEAPGDIAWVNPEDATDSSLATAATALLETGDTSEVLTIPISLESGIVDLPTPMVFKIRAQREAEEDILQITTVRIVNNDAYDSGNLLASPITPPNGGGSGYGTFTVKGIIPSGQLAPDKAPLLQIVGEFVSGTGSRLFVFGVSTKPRICAGGNESALRNRGRRTGNNTRALE